MYTAHFGLAEPPFSITPDPRYLYMSDGHREALAHLLYGIGEGGGFVQLTGEVGTGKTTLCRCLVEQLPTGVDVALVVNPRLTDVELLATVCDELRVAYPSGTTSRKLLVDALHRHLLDAHARGQRTVLIVDEAQDLAPDVLEQIRLLTNLETATEKLLQIILIGQPELLRLLGRADLRQLAQRVTARYHLLPFSKADTRAYIRHRLEVAGRKEPIFSERALAQVHRVSGGIPRLINAICDRALLGAYTQDLRRVGARVVRRAAREVLGRAEPRPRRPLGGWRWAGAAVVLAAVVAGASLLLAHGSPWLTARGGSGDVGPRSTEPVAAPGAGGAPPVAALDGARTAAAPDPVAPDPAAAGSRVALGTLLSDPALRADKRAAFASLYRLWGIRYDAGSGSLGCERARAEGLECLFRAGTWTKLRRFDLPAIIELPAGAAEQRFATVVGLDERTATLDLGGQRQSFRLEEVDLYWDGAFIVLWRPPAVSSVPIKVGAHGKDVEWVRQRLAEADGGPAGGRNRDVFDEELRARVVTFQRARSLQPDGVVGEETLSHLMAPRRDSRVPASGARDPRGPSSVSYILDALKKAERKKAERVRPPVPIPALATEPAPRTMPLPALPWRWIVAGAALVLVNAGVIVWALRPPAGPEPGTSPVASAPAVAPERGSPAPGSIPSGPAPGAPTVDTAPRVPAAPAPAAPEKPPPAAAARAPARPAQGPAPVTRAPEPARRAASPPAARSAPPAPAPPAVAPSPVARAQAPPARPGAVAPAPTTPVAPAPAAVPPQVGPRPAAPVPAVPPPAPIVRQPAAPAPQAAGPQPSPSTTPAQEPQAPAVPPATAPAAPAVTAPPAQPPERAIARLPAAPPPVPGTRSAAPAPTSPSRDVGVDTFKLQMLVYSDVPAERLVFINNRKYVEGQMVEDKALLESITPDGAVLSYQGRRIVLRQ